MLNRRGIQAFGLAMVFSMLLAACGESAVPTATPSGATPVPTTAPAQGTPAPTPAATASQDMSAIVAKSGYKADKAEALLKENMFLPGMTYGLGEKPRYGGTAHFANKAELPSDNPGDGSITRVNVLAPLYGNGGLVGVKREKNDEPKPVIAESWTVSEDFKTWTFKLRQGMFWHDGTQITADDVKFNYDLAIKPPKGRLSVSGITNRHVGLKEVVVVDKMTVQLIFETAVPHFLEALALGSTNDIAYPKHLLEKEIEKGNVTANLSPIGWVSMGPYKYKEYVRGGSFTVVRFDKYWEKDAWGQQMPYLDSVVNTPIPDRAVALGAFRAGRLEAMGRGVGTSLDPQEVVLAKRTFGDKVWFHRYPYLAYGIDMNIFKAPFDDIRVRRAVNLYMDRDEGAAKMQGGFAYSGGFLSPASWWHSHQYYEWPGYNAKTKAQDKAEAKKLIAEAGVAGQKVNIECRSDYLYMCEFTEGVFRELGLSPNILLMDVNIFTDAGRTLQFTSRTSGLCSGDLVPTCISTYITTAVTNKYNDKRIDELNSIILTSLDMEARRKAFWEVEKHMLLDMAYNAGFWREEVVAPYRTYLKGSIVPGSRAHENSDRATDWIDPSLK